MSVLLLRLAGPLQSWGSAGKFNRRTTEREPTRSGVQGLVAAALGLGRRLDRPGEAARFDALSRLGFAVRTEQAGRLLVDYHTACRLDKNGRRSADNKDKFQSHRHYLADALFLVGLEGDAGLLEEIDRALRNPAFPLFLGRRSCPPTGPMSLGLREDSLSDVMRNEPWQAAEWYQRKCPEPVALPVSRDALPGESGAFSRRDRPISFSQERRRHAFRSLVSGHQAPPPADPDADTSRAHRTRGTEPETDHDPFTLLEER